MKRTITAILGLLAMTTAASADLVCQQTYIKKWSNYYGNWVIEQGPEQCVDAVQPYTPPPVAPAYAGGYEQPYYPPAAAYPGADLLVGGLIGAGIGYAIGHNNNGKKNNYYYYNGGHNNYWHGNRPGHGKRYLYPGGWNNGEGRKGHKNFNKPPKNN